MAARALLRSVASRLRAGNEHRRGDRFVVGTTAGLRSLATKLPRAPLSPPHRILQERGLHSINGASSSTPLTSKLDVVASLAKIRAGVAYVTLFGSVVYLYGWILPQLERMGSELKTREYSDLKDDLNKTIKAVELLLADEDVSTTVSKGQSSGLNKQPDGVTGNQTNVDKLEAVQCHSNLPEAPSKRIEAEIAKLEDLKAKIARHKIEIASRSKERRVTGDQTNVDKLEAVQCHSNLPEAPSKRIEAEIAKIEELKAKIARHKIEIASRSKERRA